MKISAATDRCPAEAFKLAEGQVVIEVAFGSTAIGEDDHGILMHMSIVGGEQHAKICGDPAENESANLQVF